MPHLAAQDCTTEDADTDHDPRHDGPVKPRGGIPDGLVRLVKGTTLDRWRAAVTKPLVLHASCVVALTVLFFYLDSLSDPEGGANIGAAMVLLPLGALGLPWSLLTIVERLVVDVAIPNGSFPRWASRLDLAFLIVPAYVNVAVHAWCNAAGRNVCRIWRRARDDEEGNPSRFTLVLGIAAALLLVGYIAQEITS